MLSQHSHALHHHHQHQLAASRRCLITASAAPHLINSCRPSHHTSRGTPRHAGGGSSSSSSGSNAARRRNNSIAIPRASSSSSQAAPPDASELYGSSSSAEQLPAYVGPVSPIRLRGLGLALEAAKTLQPGETLLVSQPLAAVPRSPEAAAALAADAEASASSSGSWVVPLDEEIEAVADQLAAGAQKQQQQQRQQAWLQYLDDGSLEHQQSTALPDLQALANNSSSSSSSSATASTSAPPAAAAAAAAETSDNKSNDSADEDRLLDIADINARVLVEDDRLAAEGLTGGGAEGEPQTLIGIWPEASLLQHSCSPNTNVLLHKGCAIVTSSRSIPKQAAVYQNLLGSEVFTPLAHRQGLLTSLLGGKCNCPRCRDESKQEPKLLQLIDDIFEACVEQVQPDLQQAVEVDDDEALDNLRNQLAAYCEVVDAGFSKLGVKQQSQIWLQASLLKLYELTAIASAALGEPEPQLVELLAALAAEVAPGSSEHLFWAQQYRNYLAEDEEAPFDGSLLAADKRCFAAFQVRYGRSLSRGLYTQLLLAGSGGGGEEDEEE